MTEELNQEMKPSLDQYQFAFKKNFSTDDAISTKFLFLVLKHMESSVASTVLLFLILILVQLLTLSTYTSCLKLVQL